MASAYEMRVNPDEDDELRLCGYRPTALRSCLTYAGIILTCGFLRLFYHWLPHLYLKSRCVPCDVTAADFVLITEAYNDNHKVYYVKHLRTVTADSLIVEDDDEAPEKPRATTLSVHFGGGQFRQLERLLTFTCKKVTYIWDDETHEFVKLRGLDTGVNAVPLHAAAADGGLSLHEARTRRAVYGPNEIKIKESSIPTLLFLEVLNPFYIFQVFSFVLWFADNYYYYAAAILLMSVFGVTMTVIQTRRNQRNLKSTVHSSDVCTVLRRRESASTGEGLDYLHTETISTELLVPGDVLEIPPHGCILQCDALLVAGNCILNESMLTGESVPVTKTPFPHLGDLVYDAKEHARHTLFCGTQVIQTRYFGNAKVLAVVVRTGFQTAKGELVRSILYPPPVDFKFEQDSYRFVMLLGGVAGLGFIYTLVTKFMRGVAVAEMIVEALDLITIVVPPALPAAMTVGRLYAQTRLQKQQIFCISPRTINVSGSIDCVCFDKTGTLTEDGLDLLCVVPVESGKHFGNPISEVEKMSYDALLYGLVCCHSLTIIDKQITGDPLDLKMFESTKWVIDEPEVEDNTKFDMIFPTVFTPPGDGDSNMQIASIKEFPFSSSAQRMGVIVRRLDASYFEYYSKGSPEMILNFVRPDSVPEDFGRVLEHYTQEGYRVIALAHKQLKMSYAKVAKVQREAIESDMTMLGLIVLENRLKDATTPSIAALNDARIRVVMVTGDNILTAVSVARDCGIVQPSQSVISVNVDNGAVHYTLTATKDKPGGVESILSNSSSVVSLPTLESQTNTDVVVEIGRDDVKYNNYRFALTGKVWTAIRDDHPELIPQLVTRGSIFARMAPDQKQQLVQELQALGYYVAMCGDGANDCGALKAAHTGISLSDAESSVASPFTSKNPNITCVLSIVKEGRAALVTSFGIFKYMAAYSLCQFASVLILYSIESNLTDIEFLYIDLFIISIFAFFFGRTEAYKGKLVKETPLNSLISLAPIVSISLQLILLLAVQTMAFQHVQMQSWYQPFNASSKEDKDAVGCVENYTVFTVSSFQYIILAIVFSKGAPYRESIFSNYGLLISAILMAAFSVYMALDPMPWLQDVFELELAQEMRFRVYLLLYAGAHFLAAIAAEVIIVEHCLFKKMRDKCADSSKRKFIAIERELQRDSKWPPLTSHFHSAASPMTPLPSCEAEIVIESEQFDKNHVLNSFYRAPDECSINEHDCDGSVALKSNGSIEYAAGGASTHSTPVHFQSAVQLQLQCDGDDAESMGSFRTAPDACNTGPNTPIYKGVWPNGGHNGRIRSISQCDGNGFLEMDVIR
ncbi:polyamine-transporting ATPase 13A3-like isoform X2 [Atheta coriaria]